MSTKQKQQMYGNKYDTLIESNKEFNFQNEMKMLKQKPFDKNNHKQHFFKHIIRKRNLLLINHGYRIIQLKKSFENLAVFCFSLLQSTANFPLKIKLLKQHNQEQLRKKDIQYFWIEACIHIPNLTFNEQQLKKYEYSLYKFYNENLVPVLNFFVKKYMNWSYVNSPQFSDKIVIQIFKQEVIKKMNRLFMEMNQNIQ